MQIQHNEIYDGMDVYDCIDSDNSYLIHIAREDGHDEYYHFHLDSCTSDEITYEQFCDYDKKTVFFQREYTWELWILGAAFDLIRNKPVCLKQFEADKWEIFEADKWEINGC